MNKILLLAFSVFCLLPVTASAETGGASPKHIKAAPDQELIDEIAPPSEEAQDIVVTLHTNPKFSTLAKALDASGLSDTLSEEGPFTIFAPTNDAFAALPPGKLDSLLKPENKDKLITLLSYHMLSGAETSFDLPQGKSEPATIQGTTVSIVKDPAGLQIDDAKVIASDIPAANGVIHTIDKVITP